MSGSYLLDTAGLAISLSNTFLLITLAGIVWLNAERRGPGAVLPAGGLLAGAIFFAAHSLVLSQGAGALLAELPFWWSAGWWPVIAAPYAWYLVVLWYCGFWEPPRASNALFRRQRLPLGISLIWAAGLAVLLLSDPQPDLAPWGTNAPGSSLGGGAPFLILAYPPFIIFCTALALNALLHPAPSGRLSGDQARRRARPWLLATSVALLLVSLAVAGIFVWLFDAAPGPASVAGLFLTLSRPLTIIDLLLETALLGIILLLGQAVVAYEIFTGAILPRRGLARQWRTAILLVTAISLPAALALTTWLPPAIAVLWMMLAVALIFTAFSRIAYQDHAADLRLLRPLATSERLLESILNPSSQPGTDLSGPLTAISRDLLGVRQAAMVPRGTLAALGVPVLSYPHPAAGQPTGPDPELIERLTAQFRSPQQNGLPMEPDRDGGWAWAAPLWDNRGLTGLLLLGEKVEGELLVAEETEIARAAGERLADSLATAQLARRLAALQRQRLAESGVQERQVRRVLHDDVLPRLHAALLELSAGQQASDPASIATLESLASVHRDLADLLHAIPPAPAQDLARQGLAAALRRLVDDELPREFALVRWEIDPGGERAAAALPAFILEEVYFAAREAIRNAARHAAGPNGPPGLRISLQDRAGLRLEIEDSGPGLPADITPAGDGGHGLALHSTLMAVIGGTLTLESAPGEYTRVILSISKGEGIPLVTFQRDKMPKSQSPLK